jgi:hypothetical protein
MTFKQLDPEKVQRIVQLHNEGWSVTQIADAIPCAENTVKRHLARAGLRPRWTHKPMVEPSTPMVEPTEIEVPETQESRPSVTLEDLVKQVRELREGQKTLSKLQERSQLSPLADESRDRLSYLTAEVQAAKLLQAVDGSAGKNEGFQFSQLLMGEAERRNESERERRAEAEQRAASSAERTAQTERLLAQQQNQALELRFELGLAKIRAEIEHHSERLSELQFWAGMAKEAPEIVGDIVDKTEGRIIERLSHVASAGGMKVGGLWGEPHDVRPITFPSRKVLTIDRAKATEVMPIPDEQMEGMERVIAQQLQDDPKSHPYSVDIREQSRRELLLAEELAKTRRELEEVRARKSPPPPVSPADMPRKVIRATQEAEPNVG